MASSSTTLPRTLGLTGLVFYGVGVILGAGIYTVIGAAAGEAGDALWQAFALAGLAAALTGLSYAELAAMYPQAGAEYVYFREAWPRAAWLPGTAGWALAFAGIATVAAVARAFAGYANALLPAGIGWLAAALIAVAAVVAVVGMTWASRANVALTLVETAGVVIAIAAGIGWSGMDRVLTAMPNPGVLAAAGLVFFAYLGFEELANLAEEAQDPGRNLPLAILIAVAVSTTLYVLAAVAVTTLMRPADLARSAAPLADAVAVRWPAIGNAIGGIAMVSTANTALISLVAASRLVFSMARGGHAPGILATTLGSARTPVWALAACAASALALAPVEALETLVSVASLLSLLAFVAVDAALVRLRFIAPDQPRPFRTPGAIGRLPLLPVLGMVAALVLIARFPPLIHGIAAVALIAGFVLQRGPRPGSR